MRRFQPHTELGSDPSEWWKEVPLESILIISVAFWIGLVAQDIFNRKSWIWANLRAVTQIFRLERCDLPQRVEHQNFWAQARVRLMAVSNASNLEIVVRIKDNITDGKPWNEFVLERFDWPRVVKGETREIILASLPDQAPKPPPGYQAWGAKMRASGDVDGMHSLSGHTRNLAAIEIRSGWLKWRKQTLRVAVLCHSEREATRLITMVPEDDDIFEIKL